MSRGSPLRLLAFPPPIKTAGLLLFSLALGCRHQAPPPRPIDSLARRYVALAVQLGERDPDSLDFYIGSDPLASTWHSDPLTLMRIAQDAANLERDTSILRPSSNDDANRLRFLQEQANAVEVRARQLTGASLPFDSESRVYFRTVAPPDSAAAARQVLRSRIRQMLGNPADLALAYARYDASFVVPRDRVPAVMQLALQRCRILTIQHLPLPAGEQVQVEYVSNKPWSGFSRYLGNYHSLIQINTDYPLTVDRLLDLACHEGYPGHHVFNSIREQSMARGLHREEFQVQPTYSPQSFVSEAAASYAPALALKLDERIRTEQDVLFPAARIARKDAARYVAIQQLVSQLHTAEPPIAREYLDGRLEFVRAAAALEHETLMQHGETLLLYLNEYRTYMLAYTLGYDTIASSIEAGNPSDAIRWQRYLELMTNPTIELPAPRP